MSFMEIYKYLYILLLVEIVVVRCLEVIFDTFA